MNTLTKAKVLVSLVSSAVFFFSVMEPTKVQLYAANVFGVT